MSMAPHTQDLYLDADPVALAADLTSEIGRVTEPVGGQVTSVKYAPNAAAAGTAMPNSRHLNLVNRTQAGAVIATLQLAAGVNLVQGVEKDIPVTGNAAVNNGDELEWQSIHDGTGLADPGGAVRVTVTRTAQAQ